MSWKVFKQTYLKFYILKLVLKSMLGLLFSVNDLAKKSNTLYKATLALWLNFCKQLFIMLGKVSASSLKHFSCF